MTEVLGVHPVPRRDFDANENRPFPPDACMNRPDLQLMSQIKTLFLPSASPACSCKQARRIITFMGKYLSVDLGAESGRAMVGSLSGGRLSVEELHRFPNTPVREGDALYWDTERLWHEILSGIKLAAERKLEFQGVGIDAWGVDYGLLGAD